MSSEVSVEDLELFTEEQLAEQERVMQINLVKRQLIETTIKSFFEKNELSKTLKKALEPMNFEIKTYFRSADEKTITVDDILAEYTVRAGSVNMNTDLVLAKLKKLKMKHLIKKVETVDMAAFEKLLYDDQELAASFADCLITGTPTEVLVIKKQKAKKAEKE